MEHNSELPNPSPSAVAAPAGPPSVRDGRIVVVGAGPVGLLAAAMLSERGAQQVTVIERAAEPAGVNAARTYMFAMTTRGHRAVAACPGLLARLCTVGLPTNGMHVTTLGADRSLTEVIVPVKDPNIPFIFLRRADFVAALCDHIRECCPKVTLRCATALEAVSFDKDGTTTLSVRGPDGAADTLPAALVLACDGACSAMLQALREHDASPFLRSQAGFDDTAFDVYSSKLRVKSVILRPEARDIVVAAAAASPDTKPMPDTAGFAFNGCGAQPFRVNSLCMSAHARDEMGGWIGLIATQPDAPVLCARDVDSAFSVFEQNFPQIRVRDIVTEESMRAFVAAGEGWRLGAVRRANSLAGVVGADGRGGIVVLGDAAQSAPPDLGQGLNSGLEDVGVLMALVDGADAKTTVGSLAVEYERVREPDIDALMYFNRHSAKWQLTREKCAEIFLWRLGVVARIMLSKLAPRLFYPPMIVMLGEQITYAEMKRRAEVTTARVWMTVATAAGAFGAVVVSRHGGFSSLSKGLGGLIYR